MVLTNTFFLLLNLLGAMLFSQDPSGVSVAYDLQLEKEKLEYILHNLAFMVSSHRNLHSQLNVLYSRSGRTPQRYTK